MSTQNASAGTSPVTGTARPASNKAASPSWPWRRAALILAAAAQLITISALNSAGFGRNVVGAAARHRARTAGRGNTGRSGPSCEAGRCRPCGGPGGRYRGAGSGTPACSSSQPWWCCSSKRSSSGASGPDPAGSPPPCRESLGLRQGSSEAECPGSSDARRPRLAAGGGNRNSDDWSCGRRAAVSSVRRVIVGTSGSPGSLRALRYAEDLARAHAAILIPVLAWVPPGGDRADRRQPSGQLRLVWRDAACQRLRDALVAAWGQVPDDPPVRPLVQRGEAGWVLVSVACCADDLLVVGAGRRGALARMVCGKVSRHCLAHAQCPVLAVPPPALAREIGHGRIVWAFRHRRLTPDRVLRNQRQAAT